MEAAPELVVLFLVSWLAATLLPLGSEFFLIALFGQYPHLAEPIWAVATIGNTLGGMTNWWLGKYLLRFQHRRWFPVSVSRLGQAQRCFQRFGQPMLLFSWVPIIGDGLCLAAGVAKLHWLKSVAWIALGKSARYGVLIWGTSALVLS